MESKLRYGTEAGDGGKHLCKYPAVFIAGTFNPTARLDWAITEEIQSATLPLLIGQLLFELLKVPL